MFECECKIQGRSQRSGGGRSGLGKTMLHVVRKLIQLTIIENKWDMKGNICWKTIQIYIFRD